MATPKRIRNIGLLAHINHGKTTLSDYLLACGGVIAENFAGSARYLDYNEEEQRRGITIKTSAISLPLKTEEEGFLLNLVDTPGHVDFSGKTSRALRLIDGCLIIVDAVEGVMAQTRSVIRLALKEWVKPLLFINKVDRLLKLSFSPKQIQQRFEEIIAEVNYLIELFGAKEQKDWKVEPKNREVLFGSALEGWGVSLPQLLSQGLKFKDVMELHEDDVDQLVNTFSLLKLLPKVIYRELPSPIEAQPDRVNKLWESGKAPKETVKCEKGLTTVYVSKTKPEVGRIFVTGRVFSGHLKKGKLVHLRSGERKRIEGISLLLGDKREVVREIPPGNIFGAFLDAKSGDTFANRRVSGQFTAPFYVPLPVIYEAIEPFETYKFDELLEKLQKKTVEDPNLSVRVSEESGRILLGGVGELHLELALKEIKEEMNLYVSDPKVAYRELLVDGAIVRERGLLLKIKPIMVGKSIDMIKDKRIRNEIQMEGFSEDTVNKLRESIHKNLKSGPESGAPIIGAHVLIRKKQEKKISIEDCLNVFFEALTSSSTVLCEPIYKLSCTTDTESLGVIQEEVNRRSGNIKNVESSAGKLIRIEGEIPVRRSIGVACDIRSLTSGKVDLQLKFSGFKRVEREEKEKIVEEIFRM